MIRWLIGIWSLTAVICKLAKVGAFTDWALIDWPWHWSCLCLLEWWAILFIPVFISAFILEYKKQTAEALRRDIYTRR